MKTPEQIAEEISKVVIDTRLVDRALMKGLIVAGIEKYKEMMKPEIEDIEIKYPAKLPGEVE